MFRRIRQIFEKRRRQRTFLEVFNKTPGTELERTCTALAVMEYLAGESLVREAESELEPEDRTIFRAAFQSYMAYVIRRGLRPCVSEDAVDQVLNTLFIQLAARSQVAPGMFQAIWEAGQGLRDDRGIVNCCV